MKKNIRLVSLFIGVAVLFCTLWGIQIWRMQSAVNEAKRLYLEEKQAIMDSGNIKIETIIYDVQLLGTSLTDYQIGLLTHETITYDNETVEGDFNWSYRLRQQDWNTFKVIDSGSWLDTKGLWAGKKIQYHPYEKEGAPSLSEMIENTEDLFKESMKEYCPSTVSYQQGEKYPTLLHCYPYEESELHPKLKESRGTEIITSDVAMGHQETYIYQTADNGKTYAEIGNMNDQYSRVVTGAAFISPTIGFIGFRYENNTDPLIYRTEDGGNSYTPVTVTLPEDYDAAAQAVAFSFLDNHGIMVAELRDYTSETTRWLLYVSDDYGKSFTYQKEV